MQNKLALLWEVYILVLVLTQTGLESQENKLQGIEAAKC